MDSQRAEPHGTGSGQVVIRWQPYNAEAPLNALSELYTPVETFYVRSNFVLPPLDPADWRLQVSGLDERPVELSLADLQAMTSRTLATTMECAGNSRTGFAPLPQGEPWGSGAISTGKWLGVSVRRVLDRAGLDSAALRDAKELLFEGADSGKVEGKSEPVSFSRSVPLDKALAEGTLLAWELNGEPLTHDHGGPVRLVVPNWYGVASVKWLVRIKALAQPFTGHFQADRYVIDIPGRNDREPVTTMLVKSLITWPSAGQVLKAGRHTVSGVAWSGAGAISKVEVSVEGAGAWQSAHLSDQVAPHIWQQWNFEWEVTRPGRHVLRARATDEQGNVQPDVAVWNRLGYANNAIQSVVLEVQD